jgi:Peptidase family S41
MARRLLTFAAVMFLPLAVFAQSPAPSATPVATPAPKKPALAPAAERRALIDGLGTNELSEAMKLLRQNYIDPNALGDPALARAQLEGLLTRLGPGVKLVATATAAPPAEQETLSPFHTEVLDGLIGYVRLGTLTQEHLARLDAALKGFTAKKIGSLIFDLRATPSSSDYDLAAQIINRFVPKGRPLFTLQKPGTKEQRLFTSNTDPIYNGYVVIVVDYATAGASEVIAAVTRLYARSMVVGQSTAGQAVEYADFALGPNYLLRIAVAEVMPPANVKIFPDGVKPDLAVEGAPTTAAERDRVLKAALESGGVMAVVNDVERMRVNEASLVSGINPEIELLQDAQRRRRNPVEAVQRDLILQRAVDLITTLNILAPKN